MNPHVSIITLEVGDFDRARRFYAEGLGWPIAQEHGPWIAFALGDGSSALGLYPVDSLAADAGVPAGRTGFSGITLSYIARTEERVDALLEQAERAGGTVVRRAEQAP